jgi:hypothetical protein
MVALVMASTLDCGAGAGDGAGRSQERWTGPPRTGMEFLLGALRPFPARDSPGRLAVITPEEEDVAIYDNALVTLVLERNGQHELAGRVLEALTTLQRPDGSLPSSFELGEKAGVRHYSQSGDQAWVGYAATVYLGARADGPARDAIVAMAHGLAKFLLAHQVSRAGDPRLGLVTGGEGELDYDVDRDDVQEQVEPGPIEWVSVEHNVDAFFFLRALGRQDHQESYLAAAARIADALQTRAWNEAAGQLRRGVLQKGQDPILALDCASWGALFLLAAGDAARAQTSVNGADARYASHDPRTGIPGHKPYAAGPVFEDDDVARHYKKKVPAQDWSGIEAVWPEGSAGLAVALLRVGQRDRARAILDQLERLRGKDGGLPNMTLEIPFEFDTHPSVAPTAWIELARAELAHPELPPPVWPP